ncbi:hypothetical protein COP2_014040 [Malus domestica]
MHYTANPRCSLYHSTTRQSHHRGKTVIKGTTQQIPTAVSCTAPHDDVTTKGKLCPKGITQQIPTAVSITAPHDSAPPKENCDQKALHSETPLQSLAQALGNLLTPPPTITSLEAS